MTKGKSNSSSDDYFKIKLSKKGEQILRLKLPPGKKSDELIGKIKNLIMTNKPEQVPPLTLNVELKAERIIYDK